MSFITVPTYDNGTWTKTDFQTREDYRDFVRSVFKDAGPDEGYGFTVKISKLFNAEARKFDAQGYYCNAPFKSADFKAYWDDQKDKCRFGVIFKDGDGIWYLPRDYYMWLNFLRIYDKEEKKFGFVKVRDAQYHMALYELLAELEYKHAPILKKRQIASSYYHIAKLFNQWLFENGAVLKMGASLKDYISEKGSWRMLMEYKSFTDEHTAWYRPAEPEKVFSWQQRIKVRVNGRDSYKGNKSVILGTTFEKDPTNGVGGPVTYFFHEEAGIAPKMMLTYEYMRPAMQSGMVTTGVFIAAGSVGDLSQCEPLKNMILEPRKYGMLAVKTQLLDNKGTIAETGLFIPEQWSMPPYVDEAGNSMVKEALEAIMLERKEWKQDLSPEQYQLRVSQKPINIEEAFAVRGEPIFPSHLVSHQLQRIADKEYPVEHIALDRAATGELKATLSDKLPIYKFPVDKAMEDKSGVICVYERPLANAPWGTYYGSVDPVGEGKTTTSDSLCSIIIWRNDIEISTDDGSGVITTHVNPGRIVATWTGRFDDINKTHERLEHIIEWYNAWTLVEANVSLFIQYMISKRKQKYLVPKDQIPFLKELGSNMKAFQDYGWKNTGTLFKNHLLSYGIEFTKEEIDKTTDVEGNTLSVKFGIERIPDEMILKEMKEYHHGLNVDRLVAFCSLVAFVQVQNNNRNIVRRLTVESDKLQSSNKLSKLSMRNPFRHMGGGGSSSSLNNKGRSPFKNIR